MKKRAFFLSAELIAIMMLVCACSGGQEAEGIQENKASVPEEQADVIVEPVAAEQAEVETEIAVETEEEVNTSDGPDLYHNEITGESDNLPITEPLEMAFLSGAGAWATYFVLDPDGSFLGHYHNSDGSTVYICPFYGKFGKVEKLTDASWRLTLEELELDTGHDVGEEWDETDENGTIHYISSEPYGFCDIDGSALKPGAQFILYGPEAKGNKPGTELYGAEEFLSWAHERKNFDTDADCLGCWGLQNKETGQGFYEYHFL